MDALLVKRDNEFHYPIYFEQDFKGLSEALSKEHLTGRRICLVCDRNTFSLYAEEVKKELEKAAEEVCVFSFPAGEENKNLHTVSKLYTFLIEREFDRKCVDF